MSWVPIACIAVTYLCDERHERMCKPQSNIHACTQYIQGSKCRCLLAVFWYHWFTKFNIDVAKIFHYESASGIRSFMKTKSFESILWGNHRSSKSRQYEPIDQWHRRQFFLIWQTIGQWGRRLCLHYLDAIQAVLKQVPHFVSKVSGRYYIVEIHIDLSRLLCVRYKRES